MLRLLIIFSGLVSLTNCGVSPKKIALQKPIEKTMSWNNENLVLKGTGIRSASKFGFTAKVYRGALYVPSTSLSPDELIASQNSVLIFMRFAFEASKKQSEEGWTKAFNYSCFTKCPESKRELRRFLKLFPLLRVGDEAKIVFATDKVIVIVNAKEVGSVESRHFRENLLAVFIGKSVLDKKFKEKLLGLREEKY